MNIENLEKAGNLIDRRKVLLDQVRFINSIINDNRLDNQSTYCLLRFDTDEFGLFEKTKQSYFDPKHFKIAIVILKSEIEKEIEYIDSELQTL